MNKDLHMCDASGGLVYYMTSASDLRNMMPDVAVSGLLYHLLCSKCDQGTAGQGDG